MKSLKQNFAATIVGNGVYAITQFLMLVVLARLTNATEVGRYALALAITAPIFMLTGLKLRQVQVTDARGDNQPHDFFTLRALMSSVAVVSAAFIAFFGSWPTETACTILAVSAFKAVEAQIDILYGAMQRVEQMQLIASAQIGRGLLGTVAFTLGVGWSRSAAVGAAALAAVSVLPMLLNTRTVRRLGVPTGMRFNSDVLARLIMLAFPLGVAVSLGSFIINVPRYMLERFEGAATLGVFAAISYALVATSLVAGGLAEAASPRLANLALSGDIATFKRTLHRLSLFGLTLGVLGIVGSVAVGRPVLHVLFGPEYAAEWRILVILMVAATLQYATLFVGTAVNAMRLFKLQAPLNALTLVAVTLSAWLLIPEHGIEGAAWSVVAGQVTQLVLYVFTYVAKVRPALASRALHR